MGSEQNLTVANSSARSIVRFGEIVVHDALLTRLTPLQRQIAHLVGQLAERSRPQVGAGEMVKAADGKEVAASCLTIAVAAAYASALHTDRAA